MKAFKYKTDHGDIYTVQEPYMVTSIIKNEGRTNKSREEYVDILMGKEHSLFESKERWTHLRKQDFETISQHWQLIGEQNEN